MEFKSRIHQFFRACFVSSGNNILQRTFEQIVRARMEYKFDGRRVNGEVAEMVRNHASGQHAQIHRATADGDEVRAKTVTRNYVVAIAASSGTGG